MPGIKSIEVFPPSGHILKGEELLKEVKEGKMEGKRPRRRPRIGLLEDLREDPYDTMKPMAENKEECRCWLPRTCQQAD